MPMFDSAETLANYTEGSAREEVARRERAEAEAATIRGTNWAYGWQQLAARQHAEYVSTGFADL